MSRWVQQRVLHDPSQGLLGDCFAACVASILKLTLDEVPNFVMAPKQQWWTEFGKWCIARGWFPINCQPSVNMEIATLGETPLCIANGYGHRGVKHSVVWCGTKMVFDPHPDGTGLVGEPESYTILVPLDPSEFTHV